MKKIFFFIIFFLSQINIFACSCRFSSFAKDYLNSDIVAIASVKNVYANNYSERTYKIDLEFQKVYKGKPEIKTYIVSGLIGEVYMMASCEIPFSKGGKYLVFFEKDENTISLCSSIYNLDGINYNQNKSNIESIFKFLDTNKFDNNEFINYFERTKLDKNSFPKKNSLSKIKNFSPSNFFAVYKIFVDSEQNVISVEPISKFGDKDENINEIIQHKLIIPDDDRKTDNNIYYLILTYKPENKKSKYFDNETISSSLY